MNAKDHNIKKIKQRELLVCDLEKHNFWWKLQKVSFYSQVQRDRVEERRGFHSIKENKKILQLK